MSSTGKEQDESLKFVILPTERSASSRIVNIPHPRTSRPVQYFVDPERGIYEFQTIDCPQSSQRSWIATTDSISDGNYGGYVSKDSPLLIATPIDLLFFILPSLGPNSTAKADVKQHYLCSDDILENAASQSSQMKNLSDFPFLKAQIEARLRIICDTVEAGDETMYRLSNIKLLDVILSKARRMISAGLPQSVEQHFVQRALDVPILGVSREDRNNIRDVAQDSMDPDQGQNDSAQQPPSTSSTSLSLTPDPSISTVLTTPDEQSEEEMLNLLRLRTAIHFLLASYIPSHIAFNLSQIMSSNQCPVNFKPLDARLQEIEAAKAQALSARSVGDFSRKRNAFEDDDAIAVKNEKRRKKEEEDKKKTLETRGLRDLKKVNTKNMKKMSDFFKKSATA